MKWLLFGIVLNLLTVCSYSARILALFPFPGRSHRIYTSSILDILANRGHHIVEYSPMPPIRSIPNYMHEEIEIGIHEDFDSRSYNAFLESLIPFNSIIGLKFNRIWDMNYYTCEQTLKHEKIKRLAKSDERFDIILTESTFGQESLLVFGSLFSAPTITIDTFFPWSVLNREAGNALSVASVPDLTSFVFDSKQQLLLHERMLNFLSVTFTLWYYYNSHIPKQEKIMRKYIQDEKLPPLADMVANVSLYFTNSKSTIVNYIHPYSPNIIPIGGINIPMQDSNLPQDLQTFLDDSEGFIYFSFGTVVPLDLMPKDFVQIFINVFKKLKLSILWKNKSDDIQGVPKNVKIVKWVPQMGVLDHPKCKLLITHGGLFSHHEAVYSGVPIVGIPFFADQMYNVQYSVQTGRGIMLDFKTLSEDSLENAITTILNNRKYKETARKMSDIYKDQPMSPADTVVFWVEYVLRHGGAPNLRPVASSLAWYQLTLLDVFATLLIIIFIIVLSTSFIFKGILCFCFKKRVITVK